MSTANNPFGQPAQSQTIPSPFARLGTSTTATTTTGINPFATALTAGKPSKWPFVTESSMTPKPQVPRALQPNIASNGTTATAATSRVDASWSNQTNGKRKVNNGAQSKATTWRAPQKTPINSTSSSTAKSDEFASKIYTQLAKDGIKPPQWPSNPGARQQRNAMDTFREAHKIYREKARKSLIKADLIDDPDKRRTLDEALVFKGICEEMCPEWEKITRITEHDVKVAEKEEKQGEMVAIPQMMVKRLARSAAGQEASLPMDVRSPAACRRTLNYLIDDLLSSDERLPTQHNFLWDRTRAIRIDLSMQAPSMGPDEIKDEIYCLETIARFHVTSLHLLSQSGFAAEDFSEQQEIEQLSKTLMSLRQRYKDCADMGVACENETEFRAYYVLFFAWDTSIKETVESWGEDIATSDAIQTAMCMVESIQNTSKLHGPLAPPAPTEMAVDAASIFFSMVASPQISYTMACFAEIHFNAVRRSILRIILKAYSRPRDGPKDLTPDFLRRRLRLDTEEEAVNFVEQHGLEFEEEMGRQYLVLNPRQQLKDPRIPHAFSFDIVERKRSQKSLPEVIHQTTYEVPQDKKSPEEASDDESLFVEAAPAAIFESEDNAALESELENSETPPAPALNPPSIRSQTGGDIQPSSFGSSTVNSIFGNPGGGKTVSTPIHTSEQDAAMKPENLQEVSKKKVKFGENEYKYIEARSNTQSSMDNSSTSSGIFGFLNKEGGQAGTPGASQASNPPSWFPPKLATPSDTGANAPEGSILSGASATPTTGFKFPSFGTSADTSTPAAVSSSPSASSLFALKPDAPQPWSLAAPAQQPPTVFPSAVPQAKSPLFPSGNTMPTGPPVSTNAGALPAPSRPQSAPPTSLLSTAAAASTSSQPRAKKDPLDEFTRWFICGDRGLMEDHLQSWVIKHLLEDLWENFRAAEEERKRKEEDEKSWAEARKFRTYSLRVTYFYRWLNIFRRRRVVKRIQMEKEKARQWNMPENVAKRDAAKKAARDKEEREVVSLLRRSAKEKGREESKLRQSARPQEQSVEEALLATGIFNGVRDARAAARHAAIDDDESEASMLPSEMLYRQESRRRRKHGLAPLNRLMEPPKYKVGSKTAKLRALSTGQDTLSMSTGSLRNSTLSSSYRSSLGFNGSRVAKAKKSQVSDPYWRMKAHGLVQMPNGEYLHESLALPMLREGKRFAGFGDFGLPAAASATSSQSPPIQDRLFDDDDDDPPLALERSKRSRVSSSPSIVSNSASKRKRGPFQLDDAGEDEDLAAYRSETSANNRKRARSGESIGSDKDFLSRMESLLQDVENEGKRIQAR